MSYGAITKTNIVIINEMSNFYKGLGCFCGILEKLIFVFVKYYFVKIKRAFQCSF